MVFVGRGRAFCVVIDDSGVGVSDQFEILGRIKKRRHESQRYSTAHYFGIGNRVEVRRRLVGVVWLW